MKTTLAVLVALALTAGSGRQDPQDPPGLPKPGPEHAFLLRHAGTWDAVVISAGPDGEEQRMESTMTTTKRGAFHTVDEFRGEFMGQPFTGHGINSYCPVRGKFITTWIDSMAPSPLLLVGDYDEDTKTLTMRGDGVGMSGKLESFRTVTVFQDDDHHVFELFGPGSDGAEAGQVRIEYTRRK